MVHKYEFRGPHSLNRFKVFCITCWEPWSTKSLNTWVHWKLHVSVHQKKKKKPACMYKNL